MEVGVLGPVLLDGAPAGPPQRRAVLALLVLARGEVLPVAAAVDALWGEAAPRTAVKNLQVHVYRLRASLGGRLASEPPGYRLEVASDLDRFEEAAASARACVEDGRLAEASIAYGRALAEWRGPALADLAAAGLLRAEADRLDQQRLLVVEEEAAVALDLGGRPGLLEELAEHVAAHPLRERLHELRVRALTASGRGADAVEAYRQAERVLADELAVGPGPDLRAAGESVLAAGRAPSELPAGPAAFTGRRAELDLLRAAAARSGLVTVSGPPGVGKSALVRQLGRELAGRYPDGVLHVDLHGAGPDPADPLAVLHRMLRSLSPAAEKPDCLPAELDEAAARFRTATAGRRLLVVLDDAASAAQVLPLLPAGPGCLAVAAGRRPLAELDAELHLALDRLPEADARALLSRLAGPDRVAAEPAAAAEVLARCAGLPLAVRIAGARLASRPRWPVRHLAGLLADAGRRLDELRLGDAAVRTAFDVGYQGLRTETAGRLFRLLGLLEVPDLPEELAAALLGAPCRTALDELVDAGLVEEPAPGRYALHDLLRLYARERALAEEPDRPAARRRALLHLLGTAQRAGLLLQEDSPTPLSGDDAAAGVPLADRAASLAWLEAERAVLLAAARQAAADPDEGQFAVDLLRVLFWFFRTRAYLVDWLELGRAALPAAERLGDPDALGRVHNSLGTAYERSYRLAEAAHHLTAAATYGRRAKDRRAVAATLSNLGIVHWRLREYDRARRCLTSALRRWRALDRPHSAARASVNLGLVHLAVGDAPAAVRCYRRALAVFLDVDDADGVVRTRGNLCEAYRALGRTEESVAAGEAALAGAAELGDRLTEAELHADLAETWRLAGRPDEAARHAEQGLAACRAVQYRFGEAEALRRLADLADDAGRPHVAAARRRDALAIFTELGAPEAEDLQAL